MWHFPVAVLQACSGRSVTRTGEHASWPQKNETSPLAIVSLVLVAIKVYDTPLCSFAALAFMLRQKEPVRFLK